MTNISNERDVPQPRGNPAGEELAELERFMGQQKREIDDRLDELEAKVEQASTAEAIISAADVARQNAFLIGYAEGLAARALLAEGIVSVPEQAEIGTPAVRAFQLGREIERRRWQANEVYEREPDPDPGAGRRGARFGGVTENSVEYDQP